MKTNHGPASWLLPALVSASVLVWSGCTTTPEADEEPSAEVSQAPTEAETDVAPQPAPRTLSPSGTVVPIQPFSSAYFAEQIRAIEGGLKPLTSIPAPIEPPPPQLHDPR